MTSVWRLNIKPASEEHVDPRQFCLSSGIMGVGWAVDGDDKVDWDTYYNLGMVQYYNEEDKGWWPAINAVRNRMSVNDLCWTRDWNGVYYLGRITGEWEYKGDEKNLAADIVNIRQCDWKRIGTVYAVPGKIVNSFIPACQAKVEMSGFLQSRNVWFFILVVYPFLITASVLPLPPRVILWRYRSLPWL